jgi:hypothetical protein
MNVPQQIFVVFYAILWGTAANAQPRWRAFQWGQIFRDRFTWKRILLSFFLLNVIPILFFIHMYWVLSKEFWWFNTPASWAGTVRLLGAVVPGFAAFGFYRLWMATVQKWPTLFYGPKNVWETEGWKDLHPGLCPRRDFVFEHVGATLCLAPSIS